MHVSSPLSRVDCYEVIINHMDCDGNVWKIIKSVEPFGSHRTFDGCGVLVQLTTIKTEIFKPLRNWIACNGMSFGWIFFPEVSCFLLILTIFKIDATNDMKRIKRTKKEKSIQRFERNHLWRSLRDWIPSKRRRPKYAHNAEKTCFKWYFHQHTDNVPHQY